MSTAPTPSFPFLSLPLEIRQQIYTLIFRTRRYCRRYNHLQNFPQLYLQTFPPCNWLTRVYPMLLLVNSQIRAESIPIFYAMYTFRLTIPTSDHHLPNIVYLPLIRHLSISFAREPYSHSALKISGAIPMFEQLRQLLAAPVGTSRLRCLTICLPSRVEWVHNGKRFFATSQQVADDLGALVEETDLRKVLRIRLTARVRNYEEMRVCLEKLGMKEIMWCPYERRRQRAGVEWWTYAVPASERGVGERRVTGG